MESTRIILMFSPYKLGFNYLILKVIIIDKKGKIDSCYEEISQNKVINLSTKNRLKEEELNEEILIDEVCESLEKD